MTLKRKRTDSPALSSPASDPDTPMRDTTSPSPASAAPRWPSRDVWTSGRTMKRRRDARPDESTIARPSPLPRSHRAARR